MIPAEVKDHVMWLFGSKPRFGWVGISEVDPNKISFFKKKEISRVEGWIKTLRIVAIKDRNPWRKCHTENYWCWYLVGEDYDGRRIN